MNRIKLKPLNTEQILAGIQELIWLGSNHITMAERIYALTQYPYQDNLEKLLHDAQQEWAYNQGYIRKLEQNLFKNKDKRAA